MGVRTVQNMDTKHQRGQRSAFNSCDRRVSVKKSGKLSPAITEYSADRETPAASTTEDTDLPSTVSASRKAEATAWAARTSTGAPGDSVPSTKLPEVTQLRGGTSRGRPMHPTLSRPHPPGEVPTRRGVQNGGQTLTNVRTVGHTDVEQMFDYGGDGMALAEQSAQNAAALERLALVALPERRTFSFATAVTPPSTGQRRQAYKALEVLRRTLVHRNPRAHLKHAMKDTPKASIRSDRPAVLAHALEVIVRLPTGTSLAEAYLADAMSSLDDAGKQLFTGCSYPRLLIEMPDGARAFVEVHPARHAGGTDETWMNSRIAQDLVVGGHVIDFVGVLVFTVRGPAAVHVTPHGARHVLRACATCQVVA